jgi:hypothetical protein
MLTPRSIPGEFVSPRILRHAPSCYILVTIRAATVLFVKAIVGFYSIGIDSVHSIDIFCDEENTVPQD